MRIQNIQPNTQPRSVKPAFKAWNREVFSAGEYGVLRLKHRNDTSFFRDVDFVSKTVEYLVDKYKGADKVNVYSYGCSNGSEPYSVVMYLLSKFKDSASKFLPIIAKDYDSTAIEKAKSGKALIGEKEDCYIRCYTDGFDNYFTPVAPEKFEYKVKKPLIDNVNFSVADIREDYKNIEPANSVIFARNFWPYMDIEDRLEVLKNLFNHLENSSSIIVGNFDNYDPINHYPISSMLRKCGFTEMGVENLFVKKTKPVWSFDYAHQ